MMLAAAEDLFLGWKLLSLLIGFCVGIFMSRRRELSFRCATIGLMLSISSIIFLHFEAFYTDPPKNWQQSQRVGELQLFVGFAFGFITRLMCPQKKKSEEVSVTASHK